MQGNTFFVVHLDANAFKTRPSYHATVIQGSLQWCSGAPVLAAKNHTENGKQKKLKTYSEKVSISV